MDLLYQRYASPFSFMDGMIHTGRFDEFVDEFIKTINQEKETDVEWDIYLHKVWDKSFKEFREEIKINKENQSMSAKQIETTVQHTMDILNNYNPEKGRG